MQETFEGQIKNAVAAVERARRQLDRAMRLLASLLPNLPLPGREDAFDRAFSRSVNRYEVGDLGGLTIDVHEAAEMLGYHEESVRRLLRTGRLQGIPYGGRKGWRLSRDYVSEEVRRRNANTVTVQGHVSEEQREPRRTAPQARQRAGRA